MNKISKKKKIIIAIITIAIILCIIGIILGFFGALSKGYHHFYG
ncbi:hypothetical protein [Mycoplasmopsis arginini]|uniref:Uncharacterized protein n=1 Tax=Mycoplasmopsis arginini TaxID=2094 RepID=A0A449BGM5_MYCAR|nr:hypothetical protein [Mycoplasmopsis arginini]MCY2902982.1 hypothetical protein [Mycoplasmopsis arginini QMP CG1-2758]CRH45874.1 Uncharacterised protein [Chlamydia trachomatis]SGA02831.1 Uncharacterised protein [Chlamydia abortus]MDI3348401.1 hypothetical protein [Mycoplasmopsis arginini]MDI3349023.1 hypothetical protein [Mycoplasmopsis arginini]